jgi:hypothetical protein
MAGATRCPGRFLHPCVPASDAAGSTPIVLDWVIFALTGAGLVVSLADHVAILAGHGVAPAPPWSWLLHGGAVVGFWWMARRISAAGLRTLSGVLRMRRMVPVPVRLTLAAATLNAVGTGWLALSGRAVPGQAISAYWTMMYLLVTILFGFVLLRAGPAGPHAVSPAGRR